MQKPLEMQFEIACDAEHAFRVWSEKIDSWWPKRHCQSGEEEFTVIMEPFEGGRIFERTKGGDEYDWGEILDWTPPSHIRFLWHIAWHRSQATVVSVEFVPNGTSTLVLIVQTGWEKFGDVAEDFRNKNRGGWTSIVDQFSAASELSMR